MEATGAFGKFGAALALGSGGFVVGAGVTTAIKSIVDATRNLIDNQEQLQVAMHNSGQSFDANRGQIDAWVKSESALSLFTKSDLTASLTGLDRATHSVTKAEKDAALAADISRGTHKNLADVTATLISLEDGRTRGVQQLGIKLPIVKTAQDALTASGLKFTAQQKAEAAQLDQVAAAHKAIVELQHRYAGSAKTFADSSASSTEKLHTAVNTLETSLGTALLPEVQKLEEPFARWAQKEADSGDMARKLERGVHDLVGVLGAAKDVIDKVDHVTGGFKHTVELLIGLKFASIISGWVDALSPLVAKWKAVQGAAEGAAGAEALAAGGSGVAGGAGLKALLKGAGMIGGGALLAGQLVGGEHPGKMYVDPATGEYMYVDPAGKVNHTGQYAKGNFGGGLPGGGTLVGMPTASGLTGGKLKAAISATARKYGVDPIAALAVAAAEGGFSGAIGDNGHAFGPFQINNAGGVATGMSATFLRGFANSAAGINFAMQKIASVAKGLTGYDAVRAIVTRFERPADGGIGDLQRATAFLMGGAGVTSEATNQSALAKILAQGTAKPGKTKAPKIISGSALISGSLLDKITAAAGGAQDTSGAVAAAWLHRELAALEEAHKEVAAKLDGASAKQKNAIRAELRHLDTQISGVNKAITSNLKAQAQAIRADFAAKISDAQQSIASAFSQIISDAKSAFDVETQRYIDQTLGPKYSQNGLLTPKEKQLADMQAADTAQSLADALTQAQKQLADDMNGSLIEHVLDVSTGAAKDIFGPKGTPAQIAADNAAIDAAKRAIDENNLAIDAAKERADQDQQYANAVQQWQQQRSLAESQMVSSLQGLEKEVENGTGSLSDLNGILANFGVQVSDLPTDQWSSDFGTLAQATIDLAAVMVDRAKALANIGGGGTPQPGPPIPYVNSPGLNPASAHAYTQAAADILHSVLGVKPMAAGGDILTNGLVYAHRGERIVPAEVARGGFGGGVIQVHITAPNYVGDKRDLAAAVKSADMLEHIGTAVALASRSGHLRQGDIRT